MQDCEFGKLYRELAMKYQSELQPKLPLLFEFRATH